MMAAGKVFQQLKCWQRIRSNWNSIVEAELSYKTSLLARMILNVMVKNSQIMKLSKGKANPGLLNKILLERLNAKS
ncbi:hypothetical protein RHMOL_Rhmol02G0206400 [Rhododendron molle]|uniref:Uncharacterized protein n=1 Tax=Rhododendron molle TaxID=49168 RepID=A0ACC0PTP3_RHOML|nr:hypothetical protein RHMOL_Rhmol02G0206400 [Rhododendron molle]